LSPSRPPVHGTAAGPSCSARGPATMRRAWALPVAGSADLVAGRIAGGRAAKAAVPSATTQRWTRSATRSDTAPTGPAPTGPGNGGGPPPAKAGPGRLPGRTPPPRHRPAAPQPSINLKTPTRHRARASCPEGSGDATGGWVVGPSARCVRGGDRGHAATGRRRLVLPARNRRGTPPAASGETVRRCHWPAAGERRCAGGRFRLRPERRTAGGSGSRHRCRPARARPVIPTRAKHARARKPVAVSFFPSGRLSLWAGEWPSTTGYR